MKLRGRHRCHPTSTHRLWWNLNHPRKESKISMIIMIKLCANVWVVYGLRTLWSPYISGALIFQSFKYPMKLVDLFYLLFICRAPMHSVYDPLIQWRAYLRTHTYTYRTPHLVTPHLLAHQTCFLWVKPLHLLRVQMYFRILVLPVTTLLLSNIVEEWFMTLN